MNSLYQRDVDGDRIESARMMEIQNDIVRLQLHMLAVFEPRSKRTEVRQTETSSCSCRLQEMVVSGGVELLGSKDSTITLHGKNMALKVNHVFQTCADHKKLIMTW